MRKVLLVVPVLLSNVAAGTEAAAPVVPPTAVGAPAKGYQLDALPILSRVVIDVKQDYFDPHRIDPKAMLSAALGQVQKTVAEVMVEGEVSSGKIKVTVGAASQDFDVSRVDSIYRFRTAMAAIMGFVKEHLVAHRNLREIEYAAVNGMLSTLDANSVLLEARFFKEMKLRNRGEFGAPGLVIAMRDGNLTVVKVPKDTPAQRAGIKPKDVITEIEGQSTVNMDLQDAVDLLRGTPGSAVAVAVSTPGSTDLWRLQIVREIIYVGAVPFAKLLDRGIAYVKLSQFSVNATRDLSHAIAQERAQAGGALGGLILDLRGNQGGLLQQAIQTSDLFLSDGVIVTVAGAAERKRIQEEKRAHADGDDLIGLPMVVLVDGASAAASEIVAGALRDNGRAVVVGQRTHGSGSIQLLYDYEDPSRPGEKSGLKLTIAEWRTPRGVSIHEAGITPDVLLVPSRVLPDGVTYFAPRRSAREIVLANPFQGRESGSVGGAAKREQAALELRYLIDTNEHGEAEANPDELVEDYEIRFARDLLARAPFAESPRQLEAAKALVAEKHTEEEARLEARLSQFGVDWTGGAATGNPRAVVSIAPVPGKRTQAGETVPWTVTVENRGDGLLRRLRAWTASEKSPILDHREFIFGMVKPGEKRSWTVPLKLPRSLDSRRDDVVLHFEEDGGHAPADVATSLEVLEQPRPLFAFSTQVDDEATGNGDGLVERGEELSLRVDVHNVGAGASGEKTYVSVKNLGDEKVFIKKGRGVVGALKPGEVKTVSLQIEVKKGLEPDKVPLRLQIVDEEGEEHVSERIELPVAAEGPARAPAQGAVRVTGAEALLLSGAGPAAAPIALARKGVVLPVLARVGDYYKVEWQKGRFGFAAASAVQAAPKAKLEGHVAEIWQREPPRIVLVPDPAQGAPVVDGEKFHIEGTASTPPPVDGTGTLLRDAFVFVNEQKVFFKVVPENSAARSMDFAADFTLKPGNNTVTVYAREDEEFQSRRTLVVHRRSPGEAADTPPDGALQR